MLKYSIIIVFWLGSLSLFAKVNFNGVSFDARYNYYQISVNIGPKSIGQDANEIMGIFLNEYNNDFSINTKVDLGLFEIPINTGKINVDYSIQFSLFNLEVIPEDKYNMNEQNISGIPTLASTTWIFLIYVVGMNFGKEGNEDEYLRYMVIPAAFINSVHSVSLLDNYQNNRYNDLSVFLHSQLDYFMEKEIPFFRYQPEIGLQYTYINGNDSSYGFSGSVGVKFTFDFVHDNFVYNNPLPSVSLCFYLGSLRKSYR
jgi:hypothetical protein